MGPTATGKTDLACNWASTWPFEIISIDSALIYREMDIGTAKPSPAELIKTPHHLINICDPIDSFSVAECQSQVYALCDAILKSGKIPLLVGGTMMYFHAIQQGLAKLPAADELVRHELEEKAQENGWGWMHQWLSRVDSESAFRIHPHDKQRIGRALEVYLLSGKPLSALLVQAKDDCQAKYQFENIGLIPDNRSWLHQRIEVRFQWMLQNGLIEEAEYLLNKWNLQPLMPAYRLVGYRQAFEYLQHKSNRIELEERGIFATRQLAKRQLTWLRGWSNLSVFIPESTDFINKISAMIAVKLENT